MKIQRREFLNRSALGLGGLLLGAGCTTPAQSRNYDPFERVALGRTNLRFSRVILGTGMKGGQRESNHTRMGKEKFEQLIRASHERGVDTFDLADMYGTHPFVIPALKGIRRDRFNVITKIWFRPGGIPESERPGADVCVERFLRELRTDYLDLVLLHCVAAANWLVECRPYMDTLSKLKAQGKVRALGVSCHSLEALAACATEPWVDSVHTRINPYGMSMDGTPEQVVPVLQRIHAAGKGVVGMKIIGEGRLRNDEEKRQASIKFALTLGCVDVLNVGCESTNEVDDLAAKVKLVERT